MVWLSVFAKGGVNRMVIRECTESKMSMDRYFIRENYTREYKQRVEGIKFRTKGAETNNKYHVKQLENTGNSTFSTKRSPT